MENIVKSSPAIESCSATLYLDFLGARDYYLSFGNNRSVNIIRKNYWSDARAQVS